MEEQDTPTIEANSSIICLFVRCVEFIILNLRHEFTDMTSMIDGVTEIRISRLFPADVISMYDIYHSKIT
jgi:hypothetical protein